MCQKQCFSDTRKRVHERTILGGVGQMWWTAQMLQLMAQSTPHPRLHHIPQDPSQRGPPEHQGVRAEDSGRLRWPGLPGGHLESREVPTERTARVQQRFPEAAAESCRAHGWRDRGTRGSTGAQAPVPGPGAPGGPRSWGLRHQHSSPRWPPSGMHAGTGKQRHWSLAGWMGQEPGPTERDSTCCWRSPTLQADSLPAEPQGKRRKRIGEGEMEKEEGSTHSPGRF